jgi:hypothetical protein
MILFNAIPWSSHWRKDILTAKKEWTLPENASIEQWRIPKGTTVRYFQNLYFGYILLPRGAKDCRGFEIPKRLFKE